MDMVKVKNRISRQRAIREYQKVLDARKRLDAALKLFLRAKISSYQSHREELLKVERLKLKGGPRDLSGRLRFYLYGK